MNVACPEFNERRDIGNNRTVYLICFNEFGRFCPEFAPGMGWPFGEEPVGLEILALPAGRRGDLSAHWLRS